MKWISYADKIMITKRWIASDNIYIDSEITEFIGTGITRVFEQLKELFLRDV